MDKDYVRQVELYLASLGKLDTQFNAFGRLYSMTNENIYGFLSNLNLKDKEVLTVTGSGDQLINSYLLGAKNVTCFDSNPLTFINLKLKKAAIKSLSLDEFIDFFGMYGGDHKRKYLPLDNRLFERISKDLDYETKELFDFIINRQQGIAFDDIYFDFDRDIDVLKFVDGYLNKDSFAYIKNILENKELSFINSNLNSLSTVLGDKKYDLILLSNISDYINKMYKKNSLAAYKDVLIRLTNNLNLGGIMQVGYLYHHKHHVFSDFYVEKKRLKYFPKDEFSTINVMALDTFQKKDKVIIYKK